jgi:hypothetical protein
MAKAKLTKEEKLKIAEEKRKEALEKAIAGASDFKREYKKQLSTAIITALGLTLALTWKDVITALIPSIAVPVLLEQFPALASLYTAIIITVIAVFGIVMISRWEKPSKK